LQFIFSIAYAIFVLASLYFIALAFRQSILQGFLVFLVPFYIFVWASRNQRLRQLWWLYGSGLALWVLGGLIYS
jgi:hypothetical protein